MNLETIEKEEESISSLVSGVYSELQDLHAGRVAHKGLLTGFADLDEITTGLNKGELIVIAGRPSMGKDVFAKQIVGNVALRKGVKPHIAIFSLERTAQQWLKRMFSIESRVNFSKFITGKFTTNDWKKLTATSRKIAASNLYINDEMRSIEQIIKQSQKLHKTEHGLDLIVIEHLQLIGTNKTTRKQIPYALKSLAKEIDTPIVVLSRVNRNVENRVDKRPSISDIHIFTEIEQYADIIMFLYRDEVYNKKASNEGCAELIVSKNKDSYTGNIRLKFNSNYCGFKNIDH